MTAQTQRAHVLPMASTASSDLVMDLAPNLAISPDLVTGNGIAGFGVPGSGKTGILVRILEQASTFSLPFVAFDKEGDVISAVSQFPRGVIATATNCPTGRDILSDGLQVVYDLSTWPHLDTAGTMVAGIVNQLMTVADSLPFTERVPCWIALDEAAYWLPQRPGKYLADDTFRALHDAFHMLAIRGRKRGLTPLLFTQKISELSKEVLAPGLYIFLAQTVDTDLKRYMEYLTPMGDLTGPQFKKRLSTLKPGAAVVKLPNGAQKLVKFHERESIHVSHTPRVQAALNRYANRAFNPDARFGAYIEESSLREQATETPAKSRKSGAPHGSRNWSARIAAVVEQHPTMGQADIVRAIGCDASIVSRWFKKRRA